MSLRCLLSLIVVPLLWSGLCPGQAAVEGHVELPKAKTAPVVNKRYEIVSKGGVVSVNPPLAVVYVEGSFAKSGALPVRQVDQKDLTFVPALLPVQVGTKVEFPNSDDTYHNVFSFSAAKRFDLGRYRKEEKPVPFQIFDKPGLITLRCDIHEHMRGLILVLDSPHFVMTDPDGHFKLSGLPAGHYTLKAWLNSRTTLEKPVDLGSGTLKMSFP
jgi:plastocyanin